MKKMIATLLVLAMACTMLAGCGGGASDDTVVIGYIGDLSGSDAYVGVPPQLFLQDYFAEMNANGGLMGKQVKFVAYDMQPDNAVDGLNACKRLIDQDHAIAILGPSSSSAAIPMAAYCGQTHVPFIATSATNELVTVAEDGSLNEYAFRVSFIDSYQGTAAAIYAQKEGIQRVGMIETNGNPYSQNICNYFAEAFTERGGEIVDRIAIQQGDVDFRAQLTNYASLGIDAIFMPSGTYVQPAYVVQQAEELGLDLKFIFSDGVYDPTLLELCGDALDGSILTVGVYGENPEYAAFAEEYNAKHDEYDANIFVYLVYDAVKLLEWAIADCGELDSVKIRDSLENAKDVELFTDKHFSVDPTNHNPLNKMVEIVGFKNGEFYLVDEFYPSEG